jgi:nuclear pore complex protein Nup155
MSTSTAPVTIPASDANASAGNRPRTDPFLTNDFYPLNQAHNAILTALRADESAPDADLSRRIASSSSTSSDVQGHTYRALQSASGPNGAAARPEESMPAADVYSTLSHANSIPLPPYLTNVIKETKISSLMGILPEGNMVWVSVDGSLYLWEYGSLSGGRKKEDFVCFQVPSGQCVVSVGIVKPKPGKCFSFVSEFSFFMSFLDAPLTRKL